MSHGASDARLVCVLGHFHSVTDLPGSVPCYITVGYIATQQARTQFEEVQCVVFSIVDLSRRTAEYLGKMNTAGNWSASTDAEEKRIIDQVLPPS